VTTLLASLVLAAGCDKAAPTAGTPAASAPTAGALRVLVSILPQAYFVERIGADRVQVDVLVGPGQSPATYAPTPRQVGDLERADVYFAIGVPFERRLLAKLTGGLRDLNVVETQAGIPLRAMKTAHTHQHDHDHAVGEDAHAAEAEEPAGTKDPHIWLDPRLVKLMATTICEELCRLDPSSADTFRANLAAFHGELDAVDARIRALLAPLKGREFLVFHPAYGYFGDSYGLEQVAVEIEGKEASPRQLTMLIEKAKAAGARVIFVQPQFSMSSAEALAREIGGAVIPLDPLARDYLGNLEVMAEKLARGLREGQP
jgi:zinc transport system substrate-binding protein